MVEENVEMTKYLMQMTRVDYPNLKVFIWSGYTYEQLLARAENEPDVKYILDNANYLIDGLYVEAERDITLPMRGSRNQRVIDLKTKEVLDV